MGRDGVKGKRAEFPLRPRSQQLFHLGEKDLRACGGELEHTQVFGVGAGRVEVLAQGQDAVAGQGHLHFLAAKVVAAFHRQGIRVGGVEQAAQHLGVEEHVGVQKHKTLAGLFAGQPERVETIGLGVAGVGHIFDRGAQLGFDRGGVIAHHDKHAFEAAGFERLQLVLNQRALAHLQQTLRAVVGTSAQAAAPPSSQDDGRHVWHNSHSVAGAR